MESVNENGTSMEITLDASAIQGFTAGGTVAMYVQPEKQAAKVNVGSYTIPKLDITSTLPKVWWRQIPLSGSGDRRRCIL